MDGKKKEVTAEGTGTIRADSGSLVAVRREMNGKGDMTQGALVSQTRINMVTNTYA